MKEKNALFILQNWLINNCNGDWEHEYGVKIETIDNPGWSIKIELTGTPLENLSFSKIENKDNIYNCWLDIKVENDVFIAFGYDLSELVNVFYEDFLIPNLKISNFLYPMYTKVPNSNPGVWRELVTKMIDINEFKIIDIPDMDFKNLKVEKVEDFEKINFSKLATTLDWNIGDIVKCQLVKMFDYPTLIVIEK